MEGYHSNSNIFAGVSLNDNKTISEYNIKDGSIMYCVEWNKLSETGLDKLFVEVRTDQTFSTLYNQKINTIHHGR